MSHLRRHVWADRKTVTWKVQWREKGRMTSATFRDEATARIFQTVLDQAGSSAAWEWLANAEKNAEPPELVTVDQLVERHITHLTGVEGGTRSEYRRMHARTWSPLIGSLPVEALTRDHIADAINALAERGLSAKSIRNAHGLLSAALAGAVEDGRLKSNPCRGIRLPRRDDEDDDEITYLDQAEFAALYAEIPERWRPLVLTLVGTGMRWGEATALRVRDVSLTKATIRISRAWKRVDGGWTLGPPKTKKSRRTITLPPEVVEALRPLVAGRPLDAWVFTSARGQHVHHANFRQRVWLPAIRRAQRCAEHQELRGPCGCPGTLTKTPRIHDLRHTHVSWLIAAGVPLPAIQRRLGHESIQTTVDVYGDLIPDLQVQAAAAVSQTLGELSARAGIAAAHA